MIKIAFWKKDSGNMMSHKNGLTQEQIDLLQSLKVGDRLIMFVHNKREITHPDFNLTKHEKKETSEVPNI